MITMKKTDTTRFLLSPTRVIIHYESEIYHCIPFIEEQYFQVCNALLTEFFFSEQQ